MSGYRVATTWTTTCYRVVGLMGTLCVVTAALLMDGVCLDTVWVDGYA